MFLSSDCCFQYCALPFAKQHIIASPTCRVISSAKVMSDSFYNFAIIQEDCILDYEVVPVQTGSGQKLAAVQRNRKDEGQDKGDRNFDNNSLAEILAIADNEHELHEKVKKLSRKKFLGIF